MKTLHCDICKKELVNPIKGRTYWHIREFDLCEDCKDGIEFKLRHILRDHSPFSQAWYENEFINLIEKGTVAKRP
ncbi:hypothetical protein DWQ65_10565 [Treponema phagedenis]|uniref:Uncharacterized protein n=1 Tax=Treponema phagedenis TaxID=162 RepID=A0A0B7GTY8_TREPH|nr:hypothetical protein [Treponema phagedenis]EFW36867.1 hypothetical protein HMPREF9554_02660 [Treponema phagedenis F0421]NVP24014.1 hypothetical protein [Treponema phagedenis]QEJ93893.1 hypothetical protein FUT79_00780 [Treponema phagedenis]QEJ99416.1 hypothetical protein FUT82_16430 [Treponema phagedenis]QEJ99820.1 hypothetical protein FUT84_00580 [Treponema phagedenis]